jgi:hypothetical protein
MSTSTMMAGRPSWKRLLSVNHVPALDYPIRFVAAPNVGGVGRRVLRRGYR